MLSIRTTCLAPDLRKELDDAMTELQHACEEMDESSSDAYLAAKEIDDSGVVLEFVDPDDEISIVNAVRRLDETAKAG